GESMAIDIRVEMRNLMLETLADEARYRNWTYRAIRPCYVPHVYYHGEFIKGDCSKGCQFLAFWGGGPDPMGLHFGPYGNSATMCHHLQHLDSAHELLVGDYVTFGWGGNDHAACVLEPDHDHGNPLLWSFGHQGAPNTYRLSADSRPKQFLRNPVPRYVPTP